MSTVIYERTEDGHTFRIIPGDVTYALVDELFTVQTSDGGFDLTGVSHSGGSEEVYKTTN
jgi:hypothetical protein